MALVVASAVITMLECILSSGIGSAMSERAIRRTAFDDERDRSGYASGSRGQSAGTNASFVIEAMYSIVTIRWSPATPNNCHQ